VERPVLDPVDEDETEDASPDHAVLKPIGRSVLRPVESPTADEEE